MINNLSLLALIIPRYVYRLVGLFKEIYDEEHRHIIDSLKLGVQNPNISVYEIGFLEKYVNNINVLKFNLAFVTSSIRKINKSTTLSRSSYKSRKRRSGIIRSVVPRVKLFIYVLSEIKIKYK